MINLQNANSIFVELNKATNLSVKFRGGGGGRSAKLHAHTEIYQFNHFLNVVSCVITIENLEIVVN